MESNAAGVLGLLASLICGGVCARIVGPKERNGIGWFFLGMIFGPIAIVLAVIAPRLTSAASATGSADADIV